MTKISHSDKYFPPTRPTGWLQREKQMPNVRHHQQFIRRNAK